LLDELSLNIEIYIYFYFLYDFKASLDCARSFVCFGDGIAKNNREHEVAISSGGVQLGDGRGLIAVNKEGGGQATMRRARGQGPF
jgi:hypothetical protein